MLTPLGKSLRKLRIDRGWLLKDMAAGIGVAPSFLSGIETGRKAIPANFVAKIIRWAGLGDVDAIELKRLEQLSRKEFKIEVRPDFTTGDLEAAAMLARFGELPREQRDQLQQLLKRTFS